MDLDLSMLMQALRNTLDRKYSLLDWLEFSLIILSSVLLGIWAAANTIALRNILLVLGTLLSIAYFYQLHRQNQLKQYFGLRNSIPLFCIMGLFLWVLAHCFLFPTDYPAQINELQSTWLRSVLAAVVGVTTGIAIDRNPTKIYWLWIGMTVTFLCLFGQYLEDAWQQQKLFTENAMQYLFLGKVNGVLMGNILIAGILGSVLNFHFKSLAQLIFISGFSISTIGLVIFSFIFILEARNGTLLALILICYWTIVWLSTHSKVHIKINRLPRVLLCFFVILMLTLLIVKHLERTPQWKYLLEDIQISSNIDKYQTWRFPEYMGPPASPSGRSISANTYLRSAWFFAGIRLAPEIVLGHGVLHEPFQRVLDHSRYRGAIVKSTHSGWMDFYFAFGALGILLVAGPLLIIFFESLRSQSGFTMLALSLLLLFTVAELSRQHCVEILFYLIAFQITAKFFRNAQQCIEKIP
jgi:hypothetical protein